MESICFPGRYVYHTYYVHPPQLFHVKLCYDTCYLPCEMKSFLVLTPSCSREAQWMLLKVRMQWFTSQMFTTSIQHTLSMRPNTGLGFGMWRSVVYHPAPKALRGPVLTIDFLPQEGTLVSNRNQLTSSVPHLDILLRSVNQSVLLLWKINLYLEQIMLPIPHRVLGCIWKEWGIWADARNRPIFHQNVSKSLYFNMGLQISM